MSFPPWARTRIRNSCAPAFLFFTEVFIRVGEAPASIRGGIRAAPDRLSGGPQSLAEINAPHRKRVLIPAGLYHKIKNVSILKYCREINKYMRGLSAPGMEYL